MVFAQFTQVDPKSEMETVFLFLRYWGLCYNWDMCNALYLMVGMECIATKVEGSTNVAIVFIEPNENSFLSGVFVLPMAIQYVP